MSTTATNNSWFSGIWEGAGDFAGKVADTGLDYLKAKAQAELAEKARKEEAKVAAEMAKTQAKTGGVVVPTGGDAAGGIPSKYILIGVAGALGLGLVIWAATRKG